MKINDPLLIAVIVVAFLITVTGAGSFLAEAKDNNYDYTPVYASALQSGTPLQFTVRLDEKNNVLSGCDANGMGNRISPDTTHFCQSYTYFNARSIRVSIDGKQIANFYHYPANDTYADAGIVLSTSLPNVGAVCCFEVPGACSVCADQERNGQTGQRAFFFGKRVPAQSSLDGQTLFTLMIPQQLSDGMHTFEVAYFAETIKGSNDNTYTPEMGAKLGGWGYGDNNQRYNHVENFMVNITGGAQPPTEVQPPAQDNTFIYIIGAAAALFFIYMIRRKR